MFLSLHTHMQYILVLSMHFYVLGTRESNLCWQILLIISKTGKTKIFYIISSFFAFLKKNKIRTYNNRFLNPVCLPFYILCRKMKKSRRNSSDMFLCIIIVLFFPNLAFFFPSGWIINVKSYVLLTVETLIIILVVWFEICY